LSFDWDGRLSFLVEPVVFEDFYYYFQLFVIFDMSRILLFGEILGYVKEFAKFGKL
jgi:hypothetical protein